MKISLKWIERYLLEPIKLSPEELSDKISLSLTEVNGIERVGKNYRDIIAAEILKVEAHPNSNKLHLATVNDGSSKLEIVCGAPNLEAGQKVPLIKPGSQLPDGTVIEKKEIAGVMSAGMLCSEKELLLGDDHTGILILTDEIPATNIKNGVSLAELLELEDIILEIENKALTHRPDCFSHIGIAREIAAMTDNKFKEDKYTYTLIPTERKEISVKIVDEELCSRYSMILIDGVNIKRSPIWLRSKLAKVGVNSVNNIVDITNYIMLDTGQPLHAFDYNKLSETKKIFVRKAERTERIKTIDGKVRQLDQEMLVIADYEDPIAVAGIMGGIDTEIDDSTKTIALESANFNRFNIRKTSAKLGLRSEASTRYEKGQDPENALVGLEKAADLIISTAGGDIVSEVIDHYPGKVSPKKLSLRLNQVKRKLGGEISKEQILYILNSLGIESTNEEQIPDMENYGSSDYKLELIIPTFRQDLSIEEDILEELARIHGFQNFKPTLPERDLSTPRVNKRIRLKNQVIRRLCEEGLHEVYSYAFVGKDLYQKSLLDFTKCIKLLNPISPDLEYMRNSLIPNLLEKTGQNLLHTPKFGLFEVSKVYQKLQKDKRDPNLPYQPIMISAAITGDEDDYFYYAKGVVESLMLNLGIKVRFSELEDNLAEENKYLIKNQSANVISTKTGASIGIIGNIGLEARKNFSINKKVSVFELNFEQIFDLQSDLISYTPLSRFQSVGRDISIIVSQNHKYEDIVKVINDLQIDELQNVEFKDEYISDEMNKQKIKSLTIGITLQSYTHTLTEEEINSVMDKIVKALNEKLKAELRK
ncbi:phenylalanine--tRNA ligase subunit beta [Candidatus Dojkabacteria bacterium]|uniref:Phenylalanine--tRNA ligase beta subunit n=1 Tax=Candidatus Dojkabacteria bacterium TaxID=2099670 RepID=A0A955L3C6_9BACT|nr:phenylalanine--tRNA ligase subunit beta [Candidatus Dojkabacteria bacterium]